MGNVLGSCYKSTKTDDPRLAPQKNPDIPTGGGTVSQGVLKDKIQSDQKDRATGLKGLQGTHQALKLLGSGAAADTWLFRDVKLKKPVAIKLFHRPLNNYPTSAIIREVTTQTELGPGHINLINVYELFLTPEYLGLVMECAEGGSLTTYIGNCWEKAKPHGLVLPEDEVLYLFKQFISAVAYCHRHGIAHRDLKLDNTLLDSSDPPVLKICDFGFARHFSSPLERTKSHLGTPEYMSPELLHRTETGDRDNYDARSVDVWASGVLLLVSLCGAFPFDHAAHNVSGPHDNESDLWTIPTGLPSLKQGDSIDWAVRPLDVFSLYTSVGSFRPTLAKLMLQEVSKTWRESTFISHNINALSEEVRDLLDKIFVVNPEKRITVDGILKHPWYNRKLPDRYQKALDEINEQQAALEKHVQNQKYSRKLVAERSRNISQMVEEAGKSVDGAGKKPQVRPLQMLDVQHEDIRSIDLTESVIVESKAKSDEKAPGIVSERFELQGVSEAVNPAFSTNSSKSGSRSPADPGNKTH